MDQEGAISGSLLPLLSDGTFFPLLDSYGDHLLQFFYSFFSVTTLVDNFDVTVEQNEERAGTLRMEGASY